MLRSQRRGRDPPCWLSEKEPLVGKRRVNFQRCWLPVSRIGLHRRGVERVNCGPKLLDLGEKGVYSSYTFNVREVIPLVLADPTRAVFQSMLFSKIVPNCKKLGLLDRNDKWLRHRFEEMGVIQFEDWADTGEEYLNFELDAPDVQPVAGD